MDWRTVLSSDCPRTGSESRPARAQYHATACSLDDGTLHVVCHILLHQPPIHLDSATPTSVVLEQHIARCARFLHRPTDLGSDHHGTDWIWKHNHRRQAEPS